jgi:hypothetical protein
VDGRGTDRAAATEPPQRLGRQANTAPKIAVPTEPPTERKKVAAEVATPRSPRSTLLCTASTSTCMTRPSPSPSTTMSAEMVAWVVWASRRDSSSMPTHIIAVPAMGNTR